MPKSQKTPKLSTEQLISHMKRDLGISFRHVDETRAADFLKKNNYYYRLKCYMNDFERNRNGKFLHLDFGYLREISTIDMYLRKLLFKMSIDIEHYLKVRLVNECQENSADDGYAVVSAFFRKCPEVKKSLRNPSYGETKPMGKRSSVWTVLECMSFGDAVQFFEFYYEYFKTESGFEDSLDAVRRIRNAAAHNVCMLCSLDVVPNPKPNPKPKSQQPPPRPDSVSGARLWDEFIRSKLGGLNPGEISTAMKVPVLHDFAVMLDVYSKVISSARTKRESLRELQNFFVGRMVKRRAWFSEALQLKRAYKFSLAVLNRYASRAQSPTMR